MLDLALAFCGNASQHPEAGLDHPGLYPIDQCTKELDKICKRDPELKDAAGKFSGKFIFQIEAEPGKLDENTLVSIRAKDGVSNEAMALGSVDEWPDADQIVTDKESVWKGIVQANPEPLCAFTTRKRSGL